MKNHVLNLIAGMAVLFSLIASASPVTPDYAREKRWADEIVPGLVVGTPVYLQAPREHHAFLALFTPVADTHKAVVVVHGLGIHPDWGLIGTLRTELADRGFTTLSIQMPILAADARNDAYLPLLPDAAARIAAAVKFLKAKGYTQLAIVSHSMGSRMSREYMAGKPDPGVKSWACLGLSFGTFAGLGLPVLDMYGENDLPPVRANAGKRKASLANTESRQVMMPTISIPGTRKKWSMRWPRS